ncbi:mitochondrion organization and biogenesis protein [Diaporthe eres]|uniref:Required for respiratory growth protein 9, mitochondrial n=1 Tax=Diaporthe vaccinii TaxID=105482 RepID=A0ABR4F6G5_9PEZI|nr:mitochondrion organization and biogenesis protein [Diaporthe eres]
MACSCRTSALQIFVRSLAQVHAPSTQHARSAWLSTRPRLPSRNISIASYYRRAHTTAGSSNVVAQEEQGQQALPEDHHKAQPEREPTSSTLQSRPAESSIEHDRLFSITKPSSKNAIRKAARYRKQPTGSHEQAKESPETVQKAGDSADERTEKAKKDKNGKKGKKLLDGADERPGKERIERQAANARSREPRTGERPVWLKQKEALKQKFPEGWRPPKRLSPDALEGIRVLHQQFPDMYTTEALATKFEVSPEAIRRILRAKWEPTAEEEEDRQRRWFNRGVSVWQRYAELGRQPPRRWREAGVEASPWQGATAREQEYGEDEGAAEKVDPETATRLQAQMKLSKSLV